eukprot:TRINITY_DN22307_c0_g1_i1.p1 TRINITY_DN22307_c0_g1~~TRINITY_DN22307_c0_g1_i1.p1  ORF type:complete len:158 (-),score=27.67 TRINITY_DN22307_c0_g1_i1:71-544(-)
MYGLKINTVLFVLCMIVCVTSAQQACSGVINGEGNDNTKPDLECPTSTNNCSVTKTNWVSLIKGQIFNAIFFDNGTALFEGVKKSHFYVETDYSVDAQEYITMMPVSCTIDISSEAVVVECPIPPTVSTSAISWTENCSQFVVKSIGGTVLVFESTD